MANDMHDEQSSLTSRRNPSHAASQERGRGYVKPVIAELVGTFLFVFIGAGSIVANALLGGTLGLLGIGLAFGLALACVVTMLAAVSGAHFNPAVTIALFVTKRIKPVLAVLYIVAQLAGATVAGLLLRVIFPQAAWQAAYLGITSLAFGTPFAVGILTEAILTFFLVLAIFGTAIDERAPKVGGIVIGLTVVVDILMAGPITGGSMNPARTFGPALAGGFWQDHLVYWIGPIIGALIAALLYEYVFLRE
jgi:MIP family channel proteins